MRYKSDNKMTDISKEFIHVFPRIRMSQYIHGAFFKHIIHIVKAEPVHRNLTPEEIKNMLDAYHKELERWTVRSGGLSEQDIEVINDEIAAIDAQGLISEKKYRDIRAQNIFRLRSNKQRVANCRRMANTFQKKIDDINRCIDTNAPVSSKNHDIEFLGPGFRRFEDCKSSDA